MYYGNVDSKFRNGEPRSEEQATHAAMIILDMQHWSKVSKEDLQELEELFQHSSLVHEALLHVVGSALAFTRRCAYHKRIRADWCRPMSDENADDKPPIDVVIEMARRLHLDGGDVSVSKLLSAMDGDVRREIMNTLRQEGIELAGPGKYPKL